MTSAAKKTPRVLERTTGKKRRAVELLAAYVECTAEEILVVVPDVLGKNEIHRQGGANGRYTSKAAQQFRNSVADGVIAWRHDARFAPEYRDGGGERIPLSVVLGWSQAMSDAWHLDVAAIWPRRRWVIDGSPVDYGPAPMGDVDAAPTPALDALKHAGVLDDDARVLSMSARTILAARAGQRATVIRLTRLAPGDRNVCETRARLAADAAFPEVIPDEPPPLPTPAAASKRRSRKK